jgi:hypothetical protein
MNPAKPASKFIVLREGWPFQTEIHALKGS